MKDMAVAAGGSGDAIAYVPKRGFISGITTRPSTTIPTTNVFDLEQLQQEFAQCLIVEAIRATLKQLKTGEKLNLHDVAAFIKANGLERLPNHKRLFKLKIPQSKDYTYLLACPVRTAVHKRPILALPAYLHGRLPASCSPSRP